MNIKIVKRPAEQGRGGKLSGLIEALLKTVDADSAVEIPTSEFSANIRANLYQQMGNKGLKIHIKTRGDVVVIYAYKPQGGQ